MLCGAAYDETRYATVLEACALGQEVAGMRNGDATEVGDKGCRLSGGQRTRLALARALYQAWGFSMMSGS